MPGQKQPKEQNIDKLRLAEKLKAECGTVVELVRKLEKDDWKS